MTYSRKNFLSVAAVAAVAAFLLAVLVAGGIALSQPQQVNAGGTVFGAGCDTSGNTHPGTSATTSLVRMYLATNTGGSATTTLTCNISNASSFALNIFQVSTTTPAATLVWNVSYSPNGIDWYYEDTNSTSAALVTHLATTTHSWAIPASTATSTKSVAFTSPAMPYVRVQLSSAVATSSVYFQILPKNAIPN